MPLQGVSQFQFQFTAGSAHGKPAKSNDKPSIKSGLPRDLSIVPVFNGEPGQKAVTWFKDYKLVCEAVSIDPCKFLPLKLSATRPSGVSVSTRDPSDAHMPEWSGGLCRLISWPAAGRYTLGCPVRFREVAFIRYH